MMKKILGLLIAVLMLTQPLYAIAQADAGIQVMYHYCIDNNGVVDHADPKTYSNGETVYLIGNPARTGFTFIGWSTNPNGSVVYTADVTSFVINQHGNGTIQLYAVWEAVTPPVTMYTVTYHAPDATAGTVPGPDTVNAGEYIVKDANGLERSGYTFAGWNMSGTGSALSTLTITGNVDLYAVWQQVTPPVTTYTVTYHAPDATAGTVPGPDTVNAGEYIVKDANGLERSGYTFVGWNMSGTGSALSTLTITGNVDLYAVWQQVTPPVTTYTVTYHAPDATAGTVPGPDTVNAGEYIVKDANGLERSGYTFVGWNLSGTGSALSTLTITGNVDLYAVWEAVTPPVTTYTVTYHAPDATAGTVPGPDTVNAGEYIVKDANGLERSGYTFVGWNLSGTGSALSTLTITGNVDLYAVWQQVTPPVTTYTVTYHAPDATAGTVPGPDTVNAGEYIVKDANGLERSGYTFVGWNLSGTGSALSTLTITGNVDLYAVWQQVTPPVTTYTVTYHAPDATAGTVPDLDMVTAGVYTVKGGDGLVRSGYTFVGWNLSGTGSPLSTIMIGQANVQLYAIWIANPIIPGVVETPALPPEVTPTLPPIPATPIPTVVPSAPVTPTVTATPAATVTPAPTASPSPALTTIPEESAPLGPSPDAGLTEIPDEAVPLEAQPETTDVLTLVNLIAMVVTVLGAVLLLFKKSKKNEETGKKEESGFKRTGTKVISLVAAVGGIVYFFLTQPLTGLDIWDKFSVWQLLILVVYIAMAIVAYVKKKTQDKTENANA